MSEPIPDLNPPAGGRWLRDPHTGVLVPAPADSPEPQPTAPPAPEE